jgi:hypothetical protein
MELLFNIDTSNIVACRPAARPRPQNKQLYNDRYYAAARKQQQKNGAAGVQSLWAVALRSWYLSPAVVREPKGKETFAVGSRYKATASKDCNKLRSSVPYSEL